MATVTSGTTASIYCPLAGDISVTPGQRARVRVENPRGNDSFAQADISAARTFSVAAGEMLFIEAVGADVTYSTPAQYGGVVTSYTAAQLTALAAAGGLTPYATYVASDTGIEYDAINSTTLVCRETAPVSAGAASAAQNTARLNAMLAAGGRTVVATPGDIYINKTLLMPSDSELSIAPGSRLKLADGSSCQMVRNKYAQNALRGDAGNRQVAVSGGVATITEPGHSRLVGEQVYIEGALGNAAINGVQTIATVNGNVWTFACTGGNPTNLYAERIFVGPYYPLAGASFSRTAAPVYFSTTSSYGTTTDIVTVSEAGHKRRPGDHVYITGIPVVSTTFNGMAEIIDVVPGVSWTYSRCAEAMRTINSIGQCNILLPAEKPFAISIYADILADQTVVDAWAVTAGITTEKTAYDTAVSALTTYLGTLGPQAWNTTTAGVATMTGCTISGTTLTVGTLVSGTIAINQVLTGGLVLPGTYIVSNIAGSGSGSTWTISQSQTLGSTALTATLATVIASDTFIQTWQDVYRKRRLLLVAIAAVAGNTTEVGTGTAQVLGDTGIKLTGFNADGNQQNQVNDEWQCYMACFINLGNSTIEAESFVNGRFRALTLFNVGEIRVPMMNSATEGPGVTTEAFCNNVHIGSICHRGAWSDSDDLYAQGVTAPGGTFGATACPSGQGHNGVVTIGSISGKTALGGGAKLFCTVGYDNGTVRIGSIDSVSRAVSADGTVGVSGGTMTEVQIGSISTLGPSQGYNAVATNGIVHFGNFVVGSIVDRSTIWPINFLFNLASWHRRLEIGRLMSMDYGCGSSANQYPVISIGNGGMIETLHIAKPTMGFGDGGQLLRIQSGGTVRACVISSPDFRSSGSGGNYYGTVVSQEAGAVLGHLSINDMVLNSGQLLCLLYAQGGGSQVVEVDITNMQASSTGKPAQLVADNGTSTGGNVRLSNISINAIPNKVLQVSGTGTWRLQGENLALPADKLALLTSGTPSVSVDAPSASLDLGVGALSPPARLIPRLGDRVQNSNGSINRPVVYDGAGWRPVSQRRRTLAFSATPTFDLAVGDFIDFGTMTANVTAITITNVPPAGCPVTLQLLQDGTGGRTITWPATVIFPTAWVDAIVTTDANKKCTVQFISDGTNLNALGANKWHA